VSAEEYKQWRDFLEKGKAANIIKDSSLKKRTKTSAEQTQQLRKVKNIGQYSFADEVNEDLGSRGSAQTSRRSGSRKK
jgi:hypothetical protein